MTNQSFIKMQLVSLLERAAQEMLDRGNAPYFGSYDTCAGLGGAINRIRQEIIVGDESSLNELWGIFAPTSEWDNARGSQSLANEIYEIVRGMQKRV